MECYTNSREHLFDELHRIDLMLNAQVARQRRDPAFAGFNEFRGLFISEEEIDVMLAEKTNSNDDHKSEAEIKSLRANIERMEMVIACKTAATLKERNLSLVDLSRMFDLSPFDVDALLLCLAPELDLKYEKLYAYLQNDVTRKKPCVELILNLLCDSVDEKILARQRLQREAPLIKHQIIHYPADAPLEQTPLLAQFLKLDDRVLNYLLGLDGLDNRVTAFAKLIAPRASIEELMMDAAVKQKLARSFESCAAQAMNDKSKRAGASIFIFHGPEGAGKRFAAEALCRSASLSLLVADARQILSSGADHPSAVSRLLREAMLRTCPIYFDNAQALIEDGEKAAQLQQALAAALEDYSGIVFIGSDQVWNSTCDVKPGFYFKAAFTAPPPSLRKQLWQTFLSPERHRLASDVDVMSLADKFTLTAGKIRSAIVEAKHISSMRDLDEGKITADDLYQACRAQSTTKLASMARKIIPLYSWQDIMLPADRLNQLKEICAHVKHHQRVFAEWGFNGKVSLGKGIGILFVGQSGTGKTMAAEIIARELGLDLYKIDLSCVISKYIGETEKNLSKIFQEAEQSNAILFFDEADAVFGKRSEVKDSHDRYANIETNYLLQRMEEYEGTVILASNFQKNIDEAFTRRMRFVIEFPFPNEIYRRRIWEGIFPRDTPLNDDIDFSFLARKINIAGGSIRNVALNAAFMAAEDGGIVNMKYIIRAAKREFEKAGRLCVKADFEQYFELTASEEARA
jgi:SpoVK/Ycf46/Vps4 family AAA+-type ATPase